VSVGNPALVRAAGAADGDQVQQDPDHHEHNADPEQDMQRRYDQAQDNQDDSENDHRDSSQRPSTAVG